ncbi:MAG: hypothetical protein LBH29_05140, partial [Elusimicrobiota bacterium]|nr:hypothetical protein [Elusimicrobiota bacterium]
SARRLFGKFWLFCLAFTSSKFCVKTAKISTKIHRAHGSNMPLPCPTLISKISAACPLPTLILGVGCRL